MTTEQKAWNLAIRSFPVTYNNLGVDTNKDNRDWCVAAILDALNWQRGQDAQICKNRALRVKEYAAECTVADQVVALYSRASELESLAADILAASEAHK